VDAGGRGLVVLLDALVTVVTGVEPAPVEVISHVVARDQTGETVVREAGSPAYCYEVQYLLEADSVEDLRAKLSLLGDSVVIVGHAPEWAVHVHVNDVGAAVEAALDSGRPRRIAVTKFAEQETVSRVGRVVVAVVAPGGLGQLFRDEGAVVLEGSPATPELLQTALSGGAAEVVLLPNDTELRAVAHAAAKLARLRGVRCAVVPTRSSVQGLAALAVADADRDFGDDVIAMTEAAGSTRWAEISVAERAAQTSAGVCQAGDVLALIEGDVALIGADCADTSEKLLDRLLAGGGELVTLVTGDGAPDGLADRLSAYVARRWPGVETNAYAGGQRDCLLLVGVE
jgi:dihydroxyacetone kinase-like predicted kinase